MVQDRSLHLLSPLPALLKGITARRLEDLVDSASLRTLTGARVLFFLLLSLILLWYGPLSYLDMLRTLFYVVYIDKSMPVNFDTVYILLRTITYKIAIHTLCYNSSRVPPCEVASGLSSGGFPPSAIAAAFAAFLGSQCSGIELAGSIGGWLTRPTLKYVLWFAKNCFQ